MDIPTEGCGSVPRTSYLMEASASLLDRQLSQEDYDVAVERALVETIAEMEAAGAPIITDGEQSKPSFATYPLSRLTNLGLDGVVIPFAHGHTRQLPRLTHGPFEYGAYTGAFVAQAREHTKLRLKRAVIARVEGTKLACEKLG